MQSVVKELDAIDGVYVAISTIPNSGWGLFAMWNFNKNDIITLYEGQILTKAEFDAKYGSEKEAVYVIKLNQNKYVDASDEVWIGRYANHKSKNLANAQFNKNGFIVATKNIKADEEIFCYYGAGFRFNK